MTELDYPYRTDYIARLHPDGWKKIPARDILVSELIPTHDEVSLSRLKALASGAAHEADWYPHVVDHHGKFYLHDGHHRLAEAYIRNRDTMRVRIVVEPGKP